MSDEKPFTMFSRAPVMIREGVYWVGFFDPHFGLNCNPYLIIDNDEAVLIDGGSRPDFPSVMMKILQTGIPPSSVKALIYSHYDPDLCGSVPNLEEIIDRKDLKIISHKHNNFFIKFYYASSEMIDLDRIDNKYTFSSGRELRFIMTPYSHSTGSFVTFDAKTGILFTSDLFGSYGSREDLFFKLEEQCVGCRNYQACPLGEKTCPVSSVLEFHKDLMTSEKALRYAIEKIREIPCEIIAPQHGNIILKSGDIAYMSDLLMSLQGVGIDGLTGNPI